MILALAAWLTMQEINTAYKYMDAFIVLYTEQDEHYIPKYDAPHIIKYIEELVPDIKEQIFLRSS